MPAEGSRIHLITSANRVNPTDFIFFNSFTGTLDQVRLIDRWTKGALDAPDESVRIRLAIGETEEYDLKDRVVRYSRGNEGLAPVRLSQRLETGSGSLIRRAKFVARRRIGRPVFFRGSSISGLLIRGCSMWTPVPFFTPLRLAAEKSGKRRHAPAIYKTAPALHLRKKTWGRGNEDRRTDETTRGDTQCYVGEALRSRNSRKKMKNAVGVGASH